MQRLGFPSPESFGALFIADDVCLHAWLGSALPLTDDRPARIAPRSVVVPQETKDAYVEFSLSPEAEKRFRESEFVRQIWPARFREAALERFETGRRLTYLLHHGPTYENVHAALTMPELRHVIPWAFGSDDDAQHILDGIADLDSRRSELATDQKVHPHLVARAVAAGNFDEAIEILDTAIERQWTTRRHVLESAEQLRLYFFAVRSRRHELEEALRTLVARMDASGQSGRSTPQFVEWLAAKFPELSLKQAVPDWQPGR